MQDDSPKPDTPPRRANYQFTLRALLAATALVALFCGLLFTAPPLVRWLTAFTALVLLPMLWTVVLVYRGGYVRTFAIGALFPSGVWATSVALVIYLVLANMEWGGSLVGSEEAWAQLAECYTALAAVDFGMCILFGFVALAIRWVVEPR